MSSNASYGQFCPLAMASEFLCSRWTMLILRELLLGSNSFNDISKGVARMSRTLLSTRLKELVDRKIIIKITKKDNVYAQYQLTKAGESLSSVVFGMADWSQEWLSIEPALENLDSDHLLWSIRRSARPHPDLPNLFIVHILLSDQEIKKQNAWLVFKNDQVELCIIDHDFEVDVQIKSTTRELTKVYMGWSDFTESIVQGKVVLRGPKHLTNIAKEWFGRSRLANIKKQPRKLRVS